MTPHRLHVLFVRYVNRNPDAGKPGFGPHPTVYDGITSRRAIHEYCRNSGHTILEEYISDLALNRAGKFTGLVLRLCVRTIMVLSFGKLSADHQDITFIIRKASTRSQQSAGAS